MSTYAPDSSNQPQDCAAWIAVEKSARLSERQSIRLREWIWSWLRLAGFAFAVVAFIHFAGAGWWRFAATVAALTLFAGCVRVHNHIRRAREAVDRLLIVLDESQARCGGRVILIRTHERPSPPEDCWPDFFWKLTEQELDDLDLYAPPVGIFGLLNRCSTIYGVRQLSGALEHPCIEIERIHGRQMAVRWMEEHPHERFSLMAAAAVLRDQDKWLQQLEEAIQGAEPLGKGSLRVALRAWSIFSALFILYGMLQAFGGSSGWTLLLVSLLSWNSVLFQLIRKDLSTWLEPWRQISRQAEGVLLVAHEACAHLQESGLLGSLRQAWASVADHRVLPALCRWLPFAETGGPMHAFFNHALFYDLHVAERIAAHAIPSKEHLCGMFESLAALEGACSVGCFAWEQPVRCYPQFSNEPCLEIIEGCHPLIEPARVVCNTLELNHELRTWIITGSNMAGKSTFLRMAAINVLLAQLGGPCTAQSVRMCPVKLITDLRARDNLAREESYFLAEVRQLRRMVVRDPTSPQAPVLGLIDEPFRGTNSQERLAASLAVVEHLMKSGHFFLIATHEAALTALADDRAARNYHFQEKLEQDAAVFDYALREGPATTRNALKVLEREGYPPDLMDRARNWITENERS